MTDLTNPIFTDEAAARAHLEAIRWPDGPSCPYCGVTDESKALGGQSMGDGWYHCSACRKKYTVRVGTVYERSHVPLHKWVLATHLLCASKKGMSAHQLHRMLGVTYKTAWFMAHRIRESMKDTSPGPMGGRGQPVEADETYFGKVDEPTMTRSDGKPYHKAGARGPANKRAIVSLVERGGNVRSFHVERATKNTVLEIVSKNVTVNATLYTDESRLYTDADLYVSQHETVNHSAKEYARGPVHTNTIEGYFSIFKRGMKGVYQHCGEKHLHRYLAEFDFRYNARKIEDDARAVLSHKGAEGKRLTYRRSHSA
ncbi:IS1595 family transposase [Ferrovibrio sp.]|uniref:IS1595 family transposase n=1 Tax=Ferrovibrio sp. TaxID=1917215 RepID=UPI0035193BE5